MANNRNFRDSGHTVWAKKIKEAAHFKCEICGTTGNLESHHKNSWSGFPDDRYDVANGACMCDWDHQWIHRIFSYNSIYWHYDQYKEIYESFQKAADDSVQLKEIKEIFKNIIKTSSTPEIAPIEDKDSKK